MSDVNEPDDRVLAERFRQAYRGTPLPEPEARRRVVARAVAGRHPGQRVPGLGAWLEPTLGVRPVVALAAATALFLGGAFVAHRLDRGAEHAPMFGRSRGARRS